MSISGSGETILPEHLGNEGTIERFKREVSTLLQLKHYLKAFAANEFGLGTTRNFIGRSIKPHQKIR
ncbi:MAG: hypothetical protein ACKN9S_07285 [Pirellula sp.]